MFNSALALAITSLLLVGVTGQKLNKRQVVNPLISAIGQAQADLISCRTVCIPYTICEQGSAPTSAPAVTTDKTTTKGTDYCVGVRCLNGGTCESGINTFTCKCPSGFIGHICGRKADNCQGVTCLNGGTCQSGYDTYKCKCPSGFKGLICGININNCEGVTCLNGGTCIDGVNTYTCQCAIGIIGRNCDNNLGHLSLTSPTYYIWGTVSIQILTALQSTSSPSWTFTVASNRDVYAIFRGPNTESKMTEIHVLDAATGYKTFKLQTATALHMTNANYEFSVATNLDMYVFKKRTGTGMAEVYVLSAATGYKTFSLHTGTAMHEADHNYSFQLAINNDVFILKKLGASGTTEVLTLSAASGYKSFSLNTSSCIPPMGPNYQLLINPWTQDLVVVKRTGTGSKRTEVYVASAATQYKNYLFVSATPFGETGDNWFISSVQQNWDIYVIGMKGFSKTFVGVIGRKR